MFDRFMRSCELLKASWDVLRTDRQLLLLPILSILAAGLTLLLWATAMHAAGINIPHTHQHHDLLQVAQQDPLLFGWLFVAYLVLYFVVLFFNTALVGAALEKLQGGSPTVASALALAGNRAGAIFGYALVSATVGILMAMIIERIGGILGRLLGLGLGFTWTVATFLVVPILAVQGAGPIAAIGESAGLLRKTWGENLIGNIGLSTALSAITFIIMAFGFTGALAVSSQGHAELVAPIFAVSAFLFALTMFVGMTLRGIYVAAVFAYAVSGEPPQGFAREALQGTFRKKGS